jgi:hypothetical protein
MIEASACAPLPTGRQGKRAEDTSESADSDPLPPYPAAGRPAGKAWDGRVARRRGTQRESIPVRPQPGEQQQPPSRRTRTQSGPCGLRAVDGIDRSIGGTPEHDPAAGGPCPAAWYCNK